MYNSELARYMQPDPIGVNGGMNIYSYVENNPLNASDPEVLNPFMMDSNGNIQVRLLNDRLKPSNLNTNLVPVMAQFDMYALKLKNGTEIIDYKYRGENPPDKTFTADCHGWTFANGKYWINNDQVEYIINSGLYYEINPNTVQVQENDIVVYYENNEVIHSTNIYNTSNGLQEYGKNSYEKSPYLKYVGRHWTGYSSLKIYREK